MWAVVLLEKEVDATPLRPKALGDLCVYYSAVVWIAVKYYSF